MELVDQVVGDRLLPNQAGRAGLNRADIPNRHDGGRQEQQNDEREAADEHAVDVLVRDTAGRHGRFQYGAGSDGRVSRMGAKRAD